VGSAAEQLERAFVPLRSALRARQWRRLWLGPVVGLLVAAGAPADSLLHVAALTYTAATPWRQALWRIPLSVIAPALHLPSWGAVLQVLVVLLIVQPVLGTTRTVAVAVTGHLLATLAMRLLVVVAVFHVPGVWRHELDTGPSVAVLCVAVAALTVTRANVLCLVVVGGVAAEVVALRSQAGFEHAIGLLVGAAAGLLWRSSSQKRAGATVVTSLAPRLDPGVGLRWRSWTTRRAGKRVTDWCEPGSWCSPSASWPSSSSCCRSSSASRTGPCR
jgi:hypothetical protein